MVKSAGWGKDALDYVSDRAFLFGSLLGSGIASRLPFPLIGSSKDPKTGKKRELTDKDRLVNGMIGAFLGAASGLEFNAWHKGIWSKEWEEDKKKTAERLAGLAKEADWKDDLIEGIKTNAPIVGGVAGAGIGLLAPSPIDDYEIVRDEYGRPVRRKKDSLAGKLLNAFVGSTAGMALGFGYKAWDDKRRDAATRKATVPAVNTSQAPSVPTSPVPSEPAFPATPVSTPPVSPQGVYDPVSDIIQTAGDIY